MYVIGSKDWLYYVENDLINWQIAQYRVKKHYPEMESPSSVSS